MHDKQTAEVLDRDEALAAVDGDMELLEELVELFCADRDAMTERLRAAVEAGDATEVREAAHAIKGAVGVFGAHECARLALALETMGRAGTLDGAAGRVDALEGALGRLVTEFDALVNA